MKQWCVALLALASTAALALEPAPAAKPAAAPERFPAEVESALDAAVRAELARQPTAGLSVGVQRGGQRWTAAYGKRDLARKLPATVDTTYRFASITKSFTAVAVMQLVEAGKLSLDAEIQSLAPSYPKKPWPVTVEQLLGHLGGVPTYKDRADGANQDRLDTAGAIARFADRPLAVEPGTEFVYSTWGYVLLGAAIEKASGKPYGDYLAAHVFGPAGMPNAALDDFATRGPKHAVGYARKGGALVPSEVLDVSGRTAGGGTRGDVRDLLAFGRAVLGDALVSRATAKKMLRPMRLRDGKLTDYGYGFAAYPLHGHFHVAHAGGQPETTSLLVLIPEDDLVLALATNVEGEATRLKAIAARWVELLTEEGRPRRAVHAAAPADRVALEGLHRLFTYGAAYSLSGTEVHSARPIDEAFAELEGHFAAQPLPVALEALRRGHEPRGGEVLLQVGTFMAGTIARALGEDRLRAARAEGALGFFRAYREAWAKAKLPSGLGLARLEEQVARYGEQVARSMPAELARARLDEAKNAEAAWAALEPLLLAHEVHPSFAGELLRLADAAGRAGKPAVRRAWLERAVKTHPGDAELLFQLGELELSSGAAEAGAARFVDAWRALQPTEPEPHAVWLARAQKLPTARARLAVLQAVAGAAPEVAPLQEALAAAKGPAGARGKKNPGAGAAAASGAGQ